MKWKKYCTLFFLMFIGTEAILYIHSIITFSGNMVHLPNTKSVRIPKNFFGIEGKSKYTINSIGLRGKLPSRKQRFIIAFGNSTTQCSYLDDTETWASIAEKALKEKHKQDVIFNICARGGLAAAHNVEHLKALINQGVKFDTAILLTGISELNSWANGYEFKQLSKKQKLKAFKEGIFRWSYYPEKFSELMIAQYAKKQSKVITSSIKSLFSIKKRTSKSLAKKQKIYQLAKKVDIVSAQQKKNLIKVLHSLQQEIRLFTRICHENDIKVIVLAPTTMYSLQMSEAAQKLYINWSEPDLTPRFFHEIVRLCAQKTIAVANDLKIQYVDLDNIKNKENSYYDQIHFNEYGATKVGEMLAKHLAKVYGEK